MTPFEIKQYYEDETEQEKKVLYFVSEGTNSEKAFCKNIFQNGSGFIYASKYRLGLIDKQGSEKGLTNPIKLVEYVINWAENNPDFNPLTSKIIIFFDLDNQTDDDIKKLIGLKKDYIEYAFSNPKFEVVQLLSIIKDLSSLERQYNEQGFPNKVLENAFSSKTHHNSKTRGSGIYVAKRIKTLLSHTSYDEDDISAAKDKFCTNVIRLLNDIKNGNI